MGETTKIGWCDATFNPWHGCTKVGPGCDFCYAEIWAKRIGEHVWGQGVPRRQFGSKHWNDPLRWNAKAILAETHPKVFCGSMCDIFDNEIDQSVRERLWELIRQTPQLDWLLLTKRIGNAESMLPKDWSAERYPHVWLGATMVNQDEIDRDLEKLLALPARIRWLSIEPQLGPIKLPGLELSASWCPRCAKIVPDSLVNMHEVEHGIDMLAGEFDPTCHCSAVQDMLHWVITGGESGHGARPYSLDWARDLLQQCRAAGVAYFMKQLGCKATGVYGDGVTHAHGYKWDEPSEWPADLQVQEFPV